MEIDKRIQKIMNILYSYNLSFEVFSNNRIIIIDNNVSYATKRNIGVIIKSGSNVSLKIYGYTKRNKLKAKMRTNEVIFKQNETLGTVALKTHQLFKKYKDAENSLCYEEALHSISTNYFINEKAINKIGMLNESESVNIREASYEETAQAYRLAVEAEVDRFYPEYASEPETREKAIQAWLLAFNNFWRHKVHAYTTEGDDVILVIRLHDGSNYIALAYTPPSKRGRTVTLNIFKRVIQESPQGLSLHTNKNNRVVIGIAKHYGLKEYPCNWSADCYLATKDGLAGATIA